MMKILRTFLAVASMLVAFRAWAAAGDMPEALKGLQQSGQACLRPDAGSDRGARPNASELVLPDLKCALGVAQASPLLARGALIAVDVRSASSYGMAHIDGALNLRPTELGSKAFLRDKPVLLVGNGKAEKELYVACTSLKRQGFRQVSVLQGGMPAWAAGGGRTTGSGAFDPSLPMLSAPELWMESHFEGNLVLVTPALHGVLDQLVFGAGIPVLSAASVKAVIERRRKESKNVPLIAVVLAADPAVKDSALNEVRAAIAPTPLLVYQATSDRFARDMRQQQAAWVAHARGPKKPRCGA